MLLKFLFDMTFFHVFYGSQSNYEELQITPLLSDEKTIPIFLILKYLVRLLPKSYVGAGATTIPNIPYISLLPFCNIVCVGTIIRGTLKTPNSQLVTSISIKLQRPDGCD
jgi:hypothetical protein